MLPIAAVAFDMTFGTVFLIVVPHRGYGQLQAKYLRVSPFDLFALSLDRGGSVFPHLDCG
ncbi:MAG TPA: hypothetical protein VKE53_08500 [Pseudolabrys sp.]|jgi:hypothetical protein|nr:hypothetical protein [Pseudolabrys sp.]